MLSATHLLRLKQILATNDTGVPIVVEGQRLAIVRPRGVMLLERVRVEHTDLAPGDRFEVLLGGVLPLPGPGQRVWPHNTMREALKLLQEAERRGGEGDGAL
jgi:hypothetical protein